MITTASFLLLLSAAGGNVPSTTALAVLVFALAGSDLTLRAVARAAWRRATPRERVVLVGSGPVELAARRKFDLFADLHLHPVAAVDEADVVLCLQDGSSPLERVRAAAGGSVDRVVVAASVVDERLIATLVRACRAGGVKLGVVPPAAPTLERLPRGHGTRRTPSRAARPRRAVLQRRACRAAGGPSGHHRPDAGLRAGALTFDERVAVEREYVENLSLGRDLRIVAQTFAAVTRGSGAF